MTFTSYFADDLNQFVDYKRSFGFKYNKLQYLSLFDYYCASHGNPHELTESLVKGFIHEYESKVYSDHHYFSHIRDFGIYLKSLGNADTYILPSIYTVTRSTPEIYIMTEKEVKAFFKCLIHSKLSKSRFPHKRLVLTNYFYLLYGTGVRTFEGRNLLIEDIHLEERYIDIMKSKGNRDRRIYLSDELADQLLQYDTEIRSYYPNRKYFFPKDSEHCFQSDDICCFFNRVWKTAGLEQGSRVKPSPYSFRHYFAYTNLRRWLENEKDANVMITYLMNVMGHSSIHSTMYYLASSPDMFGTYRKISKTLDDERLPEVILYEE